MSKPIRLSLLFVVASSLCDAQVSLGQPLMVDESTVVGGDFNDSAPGANIGVVDIGQNVITGSLDGECINMADPMDPPDIDCNSQFSGDEQDSFNVDVPAGLSMTSLVVETLTGSGPMGFGANAYAYVVPTFSNTIGSFIGMPASGGDTGNILIMSVGDGRYSVSVNGGTADDEGTFMFDYRVTMGVIPNRLAVR